MMTEWKLGEAIKNLPVLNGELLYSKYQKLVWEAERAGHDFWQVAERFIGFFGIRMLIHALLVIKGLNR